ncbi:MAG: AAA family ATPase [Candidatus Muiribacteriota bacterium]
MKNLPIGISTLEKIITGDYLYVDKTKTAFDLIENGGGYYFLSRPRRFGKSLFLDTLKEIFYGNKELFKGLYIYDKYPFEKHPVINISFGSGEFKTKESLNLRINEIFLNNLREIGLEMELTKSVAGNFEDIIYQAYKKYGKRVVILVDEYDKPILDNIENEEIAKEIRDELKGFYSVIKDADEYLKFVFLTGVSKFSKVSLFSGLNNLNDITINSKYATICGYTQSELEYSFKEYLKGQDLDKIREWYNGYKWLGESVYNPFDILLFIDNNFDFRNYWFSTATPTFLLKLIEKNQYFIPDLENIILDETLLGSFDVDNLNLETLMWQTGYLTIDRVENLLNIREYYMKIPNREVEISLMSEISEFLTKSSETKKHSNNMLRALLKKDMESFELSLKCLFESIPYNYFTKNEMFNYEGYYVSVFYANMKGLGIDAKCEVATKRGRIDTLLQLPEVIYVIEFKTEGGGALKQIKEKGYHEQFLDSDKEIILVGIEFDKSKRNISKVEWEQV